MPRFFWPFLALIVAAEGGALLDFSYGVLEERRGDAEKSRHFFEKAYGADPGAVELGRKLADVRLEQGDIPGAVAIQRQLAEVRPDDFSAHLEYGDFLGRVGRGDAVAEKEREASYRRVLELQAGGYLPIERLIRFFREQGRDDEARALLEELVPSSARAVIYYVSSTKSLHDGRDEEARGRIDKVFENAMEDHPEWADVARAAGDHFRQTDRLETAVSVLSRHVEAVPASLDMKIRLGILLFAAKRDEEAVKVLEEVLTVHPRKVLAHDALGRFHRRSGNGEAARFHAAEVLKIRGGSAGEFVELADELLEAGEFREARLLLERAVFLYEANASLWMKLAVATARDPVTSDEAHRVFREVELVIGEDGGMEPAFVLESAKVLLASGGTKAAEERLREAIRSFPKEARAETAEALRTLAGIWIDEGRNEEAAAALLKRAETLEGGR